MHPHHACARRLASWGGFRRHYVEGGAESKDEGGAASAAACPAPASGPSAPSGPEDPNSAAWKQQLEQQLLAKRAEVLATQRKLESLSLEQRELEMLYTRAT